MKEEIKNATQQIRKSVEQSVKDAVKHVVPSIEKLTVRDIPWRCANCKSLLGYVKGGEEVRVKYKDLYVSVKRGDVSVICRKCGEVNTLEYKEEIQF